jgi:hypothetical protein
MFQPLKQRFSLQLLKLVLFVLATIITLIIWGSVTDALGQKSRTTVARKEQANPTIVEEPVFHDYKGVQIGMNADEARRKLGEPKEKGDTQDFYVFSEKETAQVFYDGSKNVMAISVDYLGEGSGAPNCKSVLGAEIEHKADGSMYKMVRYPKQGYWVSYNRTAGDPPIITVTMQKSAQ